MVAVVVLCVAFDVRSILLQQQVVEYVLLAVRTINIAWVSSRSPYERRLFRTDFFVLGVDSDTLSAPTRDMRASTCTREGLFRP